MAKKKKSVSKDSVEAWFDLEPTDSQWEKVYPVNTDEEIGIFLSDVDALLEKESEPL